MTADALRHQGAWCGTCVLCQRTNWMIPGSRCTDRNDDDDGRTNVRPLPTRLNEGNGFYMDEEGGLWEEEVCMYACMHAGGRDGRTDGRVFAHLCV